MVQTLQSNKVTLGELESKFKLTVARDPQFFFEWKSAGSEATQEEIQTLDRSKSNFENLLKDPPLLEGAVKMVVLAGLLDLAGFYQPPFRIKTETQISISSPDEDGAIIRGAIDVLVVLEKLWVPVIEAKMSNFSLTAVLPQALRGCLRSLNYCPIRPLNPPFWGTLKENPVRKSPRMGGWGASVRIFETSQTSS
jgi:hypothetical protein